MYAVLGALLVFALTLRASAQEPAQEPAKQGPAEPHVDVSADATTPSPAAALQARADAIAALIEGALDPSVDARGLFVADDETSGVALIEALAAPTPQDPTIAPPPTAAPDPLSVAREALRAAMAAFFALDPEQRASLLDAHEAKTADARQEQSWAADADRMAAQAEGLEALVAGALEPGTDVDALLRVDALALLPTKAPPEDSERAETFARRDEAARRLQAAYAAWLDLSPEERATRRDAADAVAEPEVEAPAVAEPDAEIPEAYVDERAEQDREDISDAEQKAADAAREKEEALDVARKARSEALRVVAEERARLLGIKEKQALFAAELPRWKQRARDLHETGLEWHRRIDEMVDAGGAETDADALYGNLRSALDDARAALSEALARASDPGAQVPTPPEGFDDGSLPADVDRADLVRLRDTLAAEAKSLMQEEGVAAWEVAALLRDDVVMLNRDRLRLLPSMSGGRRDALTGLGTEGRAQARRELGQIGLELRYHAMSLPRDVTSLSDIIQSRPLSLVVSTLELVVLIAGFRWWRRHADALLKRLRGSTLGLSRTPAQRFRATAIWYLLRVRRPVEWLLLFILLPGVVGTASNAPELRMIWLILVWVQGGRAVIVAVDAIAERQSVYGGGKRTPSNAALRYRSLRLIGVTVTAVGLILTLTSDIVGHGTIFRWVFQGCWVLVAPIGIWLVAQWRPTIVQLLEPTVQTSPFAAWVVNNQSGIVGFSTSTVGGLWLLGRGLSAWLVRQLSGLDTTRKVLAYLFRREVARQAVSVSKGPRGEPLRGSIYDQLGPESQSTKLPPLEEPAGPLVTRAIELARSEACTLSVVVGERGMGKTTFLKRVTARSDETNCIVGCPPAGFEALVEALAVQFDAPDFELESVAKAIRGAGPSLICIDDAQRMIAPAVGGLEQLDRFTRFALQVGGNASWIVSVQEAAWHFVERARGDRVFFDQILMLPRWTEDQISTLIQRRTNEANLKPNFDGLVVGTHAADESEGRRTEQGYYRILWDHSGGNPAVALQAWRDSLFVSDTELAPVVRLFEEPSAAEVERLQSTLLFVLRAIVQLEVATAEEVADCTQLPVPDVADAIRFSVAHGYVEPSSGRYRLSWTWYRTITRVLTRQHLLVR